MRRLWVLGLILFLAGTAQATVLTFEQGVCCDDRYGTSACNTTYCDADADCAGGKVCSYYATSGQYNVIERGKTCSNSSFDWPNLYPYWVPTGAYNRHVDDEGTWLTRRGPPVNRCSNSYDYIDWRLAGSGVTNAMDPLDVISSGSLTLDVVSITNTDDLKFCISISDMDVYTFPEGWYVENPVTNGIGMIARTCYPITDLSVGANVLTFPASFVQDMNDFFSANGDMHVQMLVGLGEDAYGTTQPFHATGANQVLFRGWKSTTGPGPVLQLDVNVATATATVTNTPVPATNTATATVTPTATATTVPTSTPTPTGTPNPEQLQLFLKGKSIADTSYTVLAGVDVEFSNNGGLTKRRLPLAIRARSMYVICIEGPGASKTLTHGLYKNGSLITGSTCTTSGAGTGAGVNTCNVTFTNDSTFDFAASDELNYSLLQSAAGSTTSTCQATVYARQSGDAGEQDSIVLLGSGSFNASLSTTYYGFWWPASQGGPLASFNQTTASNVYMPWPRTSTLTAFSVNVNGYSSTGDFTVRQVDNTLATDLTAAISSGTLGVTDSTCTTNCTVTGGDTVTFEMVQGSGNSNARYRMAQLAASGTGQVFAGQQTTLNGSSFFSPGGFAASQTLSNLLPIPVAKRSTIKNLRFRGTGSFNNACTATVYSGSTPGSLTDSGVSCTTAASGTDLACSNTTRAVGVAEGEYVLAYASCVGTPKPVAVAFELSGDPTETPTPDPAWTSTPTTTPTATPTVTETPTGTPPTATATATGTITNTPTETSTPVDTFTYTATPVYTPGSGGAGIAGEDCCCCGGMIGGPGTPRSCDCTPTPTFTPTWTPTVTATPIDTPSGGAFCTGGEPGTYTQPIAPASFSTTWGPYTFDDPAALYTYTGESCTTTRLCGTNYNFAIPGTATITGFYTYQPLRARPNDLVSSFLPIGYECDTWNDIPNISLVQLTIAGGLAGTNKSDASALTAYNVYGGTGDLWGETWTPTDVNSTDFGLCVAANSCVTSTDEDDCYIYDITSYNDPLLQPRISTNMWLYVCYTVP